MVRDLRKPYKAIGDHAAATLVRRLEREAPPPAVVVLAGGPALRPASSTSSASPGSTSAASGRGPGRAASRRPRVVLVRFGRDATPERRILDEIAAVQPGWVAGAPERLFFQFGWSHDPPVAAILTPVEKRGGG